MSLIEAVSHQIYDDSPHGDIRFLLTELALRDKMLKVAKEALDKCSHGMCCIIGQTGQTRQHSAREALSTLRSMREAK